MRNKVLVAKHRREEKAQRRGQAAKKLAMAGAVMATATAMTLGVAAPAGAIPVPGIGEVSLPIIDHQVDPQAAAEAIVAVLERLAVGDGLPGTFPAALTALGPDLRNVGPALLAWLGSDQNTEFIRGRSIVDLLDALGVALPDGLELPIPDLGDLDLSDLGVNIITTGPPFFFLNLAGLDLGTYTPAFPNQIANEINGTDYAPLEIATIPGTVASALVLAGVVQALQAPPYNMSAVLAGLTALSICSSSRCNPGDLEVGVPNLRVPFVLGWGPGALATGMAWQQVVDDLPNQPGGTASENLERSLTIVPMILLRNPGRANGGIAARFGPFFDLFGINTVTPDLDVEQDGDATLVPVKVDATVQWDPISDFPSWPNPFALANSAAAFAFPTYILRGSEADPLEMLAATLEAALPGVLGNVLVGAFDGLGTITVPARNGRGPFTFDLRDLAGDVLGIDIPDDYFAVNDYLTFRQDALPLLEPARLPVDFVNLMFGTNFSNPFADALEPALTSLASLGYTDVIRNPDGTYTRTLDEAGLNANTGGVTFGTLPDGIDWGQVPEDIINSLIQGFTDEFFGGGIPGLNPPSIPQANALAALARLLGVDPGPGGLIGGLLEGGLPDLGGGLPGLPASPLNQVASVPDSTATTFTVAADDQSGQRSVESVVDNDAPVAEDEAAETVTPAPTGESSSTNNRRNVVRESLGSAGNPFGSGSGDSERNRPIRDAFEKVGGNIEKAVNDFGANVKKVFGGKPDKPAATTTGDGEDNKDSGGNGEG